MFNFFYQSHRKGMLTFSGSEDFEVLFDIGGYSSKECFRRFDNGQYNSDTENKKIPTRHPNMLYSVIKGKKSWGLSVKEWSMGISECNFTREEILQQFTDKGIEIPESLLKDFDNNIKREKMKRNDREYERLEKEGFFKKTKNN